MYIIYNRDGSIKKVKLTDFINKGSDGINTINVAIDDFDLTGVTAHVQWTLPNGENIGPLPLESGEPFDDDVGDHYENCFVVSIDAPETLFEGLLKGSLVLIDAQTRILYTYPIKLVINPSTFVPSSSTNITTEQYAALVEYIETNYVKGYSKTETNALLADKADKVGALPIYSVNKNDNVYDFVVNNELSGKACIIIIDNLNVYYAGFNKLSRTIYFELKGTGIIANTRFQGSCGSNETFADIRSNVKKFELEDNKVTSLTDQSTDTQYPGAKAVVDYVKTKTQKIGAFMGNARGLNKLYFLYRFSHLAPSPSDVLPQDFNLETFEPDDAHTLDISGIPMNVGNDDVGYLAGGTTKSMRIFAETFLYNDRILAVYTPDSGDRGIILVESPAGKKYIVYSSI